MADYRKMFQDELMKVQNNQDPAVAQLEQQIMNQQQGANITPTLGLVDHFTGSNFASMAPKQESKKEQLAQLLSLRGQQQKQRLDGLGKLAGMQDGAEQRAAERAFKEKMYDMQMAMAKMKAGAKPKMGSEDKKALGFTSTLLRELPKLRAMYESGKGTIRPSLVGTLTGQNEAELIANALAENYGRLQSGGAISKDEESRFLSRLGSMMDSNEVKLEKLKQIEEEIRDKHALYGGGDIPGYSQSRMPSGGSASQGAGNYEDMSEAELELMMAQRGL